MGSQVSHTRAQMENRKHKTYYNNNNKKNRRISVKSNDPPKKTKMKKAKEVQKSE
jgi:hypothetical protein